MRDIVIEKAKRLPIEKQAVEIVERKGLGHPDTICDAVCEAVSRKLSKYYLEHFGKVLHHNVDKGLLVAGKSMPKFGGGSVVKPFKIIVAGRATSQLGKEKINVGKIAIEAVRDVMKNFHMLEQEHYKIEIEIEEGAGNLQEVFRSNVELANDTSFGVGYAPYSRTENLVLAISDMLNSKAFIKKFPAVGEDIKVMALRERDEIKVTVAVAFIDKYISGIEEYYEVKEKIREEIKRKAKKYGECDVIVNALDKPAFEAKSIDDVYLTVTGLSAEMGDDGQVGRGNRVNGLTTPCREMSLEAAAGKNPTRHVGKLYNVLANIIASDIVKQGLANECYVKILSRIGSPVNEPQAVSVQIVDGFTLGKKNEIKAVVESWLDRINEVIPLIVDGKLRIY